MVSTIEGINRQISAREEEIKKLESQISDAKNQGFTEAGIKALQSQLTNQKNSLQSSKQTLYDLQQKQAIEQVSQGGETSSTYVAKMGLFGGGTLTETITGAGGTLVVERVTRATKNVPSSPPLVETRNPLIVHYYDDFVDEYNSQNDKKITSIRNPETGEQMYAYEEDVKEYEKGSYLDYPVGYTPPESITRQSQITTSMSYEPTEISRVENKPVGVLTTLEDSGVSQTKTLPQYAYSFGSTIAGIMGGSEETKRNVGLLFQDSTRTASNTFIEPITSLFSYGKDVFTRQAITSGVGKYKISSNNPFIDDYVSKTSIRPKIESSTRFLTGDYRPTETSIGETEQSRFANEFVIGVLSWEVAGNVVPKLYNKLFTKKEPTIIGFKSSSKIIDVGTDKVVGKVTTTALYDTGASKMVSSKSQILYSSKDVATGLTTTGTYGISNYPSTIFKTTGVTQTQGASLGVFGVVRGFTATSKALSYKPDFSQLDINEASILPQTGIDTSYPVPLKPVRTKSITVGKVQTFTPTKKITTSIAQGYTSVDGKFVKTNNIILDLSKNKVPTSFTPSFDVDIKSTSMTPAEGFMKGRNTYFEKLNDRFVNQLIMKGPDYSKGSFNRYAPQLKSKLEGGIILKTRNTRNPLARTITSTTTIDDINMFKGSESGGTRTLSETDISKNLGAIQGLESSNIQKLINTKPVSSTTKSFSGSGVIGGTSIKPPKIITPPKSGEKIITPPTIITNQKNINIPKYDNPNIMSFKPININKISPISRQGTSTSSGEIITNDQEIKIIQDVIIKPSSDTGTKSSTTFIPYISPPITTFSNFGGGGSGGIGGFGGFGFPDFGGGSRKVSVSKVKGRKVKAKYSPNIVSVIGGFKTSKTPSFKFFTGGEVRPFVQPKKKKKEYWFL